jgi:acyltransferase
MAEIGQQRLGYIDWLRGLACLAMFQVHCYDSWLSPAARNTTFYGWSRFGGILPAPLFLFLAGVSVAFVTDKMQRKGISANRIASATMRRGAEVFGLALLFRVQEFAFGWPWSPWTDLLRVDILNTIGLSIVFMGAVCWLAQGSAANAMLAGVTALGISMATPPLWTTWRPRWLPWFIESYINGVHVYDKPQSWLFPIFPWAGFAFAGLAVGFILFSDWSARNPGVTVGVLGAGGVGIYYLSMWLDASPVHLYAVYDYWHTGPNFFLLRVAMLLGVLVLGYAWCRWGAGQWGFSPLIQMGQTSLLVYWVHIEFVYGRFSILRKGAQTIPTATFGLVVIFVAMVLLSMARTRWKGHGAEVLAWVRREPRPAAES